MTISSYVADRLWRRYVSCSGASRPIPSVFRGVTPMRAAASPVAAPPPRFAACVFLVESCRCRRRLLNHATDPVPLPPLASVRSGRLAGRS